ncbi:MAG: DUF3458 domain-containing protein, partial [Betaproteobacteria bacterium]|nr:DUF3458 domain-containing protein [Betaproteobacteria bacterium]
QVAKLARCDGDPVNRWMMMQRLMSAAILGIGSETPVIEALKVVLLDKALDPAFAALMLSFPPELELAQAVPVFDPQALRLQRNLLMKTCADELGQRVLMSQTQGRLASAPLAMQHLCCGHSAASRGNSLKYFVWLSRCVALMRI